MHYYWSVGGFHGFRHGVVVRSMMHVMSGSREVGHGEAELRRIAGRSVGRYFVIVLETPEVVCLRNIVQFINCAQKELVRPSQNSHK